MTEPNARVSLPLYLTRFVGREQECATLSSLLQSKRLLTLIGTGGVGKTRLAVEIAATLSSSFPDGIYMVELASLTDPHLVPYTIAAALGVRTDVDSPLPSLLIDALRERRVLLLLDNCEHLLVTCAPLVGALLQSCPYLRLLVTSREPLGVTGETVWRLTALPTPDPQSLSGVEQLARYEAIQLFCERATENRPPFRFTQQNAATIAHLCTQLDGLPLALELAAAQLPMLSVDQLVARLDERFTLLKHGKWTAAARHLSLQAALDWSYALLTPSEQALFARLAIFAGSCDLDAVTQVCVSPAEPMLFEALARLVNASLVIAEEQEGQEPDSTEVRYRLLNTIQQYALEKLEQPDDWPQLCEQHYAWYLQLAEHANGHLHGPEQLPWLQRMEIEKANMGIALTRMLAAKQLDKVAQLADMLRRFWITRNYFSEGRHWFEILLTADNAEHLLSPAMRARVLFGASEFARYQGASDHAHTLLEDLLALQEELNDAFGLMEAKSYLGLVVGLRGDYERANTLCQESLAFYRQQGYHQGIMTVLTSLAFVMLAQGQYTRAMAVCTEAGQMLRKAGNRGYLLYVLFTLAQAALLQGEVAQARETIQEAFHIAQELRHTYGIAASFGLIAGLAGLQGQHVQAARLFGEAQALQDRVQAPHPPAGRALLERMVFTTQFALGKEQFIAHYSAGQSCPLEEMLLEAQAILQMGSTSTSPAATTTPSSSPELARLSRRELEILKLLATGLTDAQIAEHLHLSVRTVGKHVQFVYSKLDIHNRSAATSFAIQHGLL